MQTATSNLAIHQDYTLLIEGEKCPFVSASISYAVGSMPEMVIQLAPYRTLRGLSERTKVHLYFKDPVDGIERLLFDGEIRGEGLVKTPATRTMSYSVSHVSHYLDEVLLSFTDPWTFGMATAGVQADVSGVTKKTLNATFNTLIEQYFRRDGLGEANTAGSFHTFFKRFFEDIIDTSDTTQKQTSAFKYFLDKIEEWKVLDRIAVLPAPDSDANANSAFKLSDFVTNEQLKKFWHRIGLNVSSGTYSIFQLFNRVFQYIFYVPIILPTPYLKDKVQQSILYKPQSLFVSPPTCNVIWLSMYNTFSYSRDFKTIPTRMFAVQKSSNFNVSNLSASNYIWAPSVDITQIALNDDGTDKAVVQKDIEEAMNIVATSTGEDITGARISQHAGNDIISNYINWLGSAGTGKHLSNFRKMLKLMDYELDRQRLQSARSSINMVFNPYIVPGFPCLIMDRPDSGMHMYGYVMAVSHNINAKHGSTTVADVGYLRQYDTEFISTFPVADDVWANENKVYLDLFGIPSIQSDTYVWNNPSSGDSSNKHTNIPLILEAKLKQKGYGDFPYNAYVKSYRRIISKEEYENSEFGNKLASVYDTDTATKVREYRKLIRTRTAGSPPVESVDAIAKTAGATV